jgi:ElaB/YqjD/DUF883 family membrane-anchored ribosome-binding protein
MNNYSNTTSFGSADWLRSTLKKNPEGLLLLAASCALLLRSGGTSRAQAPDEYQMHGYGSSNRNWNMPNGMSRAAESAREYASNAGKNLSETSDKVSKTLSETADRVGKTVSETTDMATAGEYVDEARRAMVDQSGRIAQQAQSTIERMVREQPLTVAIAGLAAGAAVAAAFPATQLERDTLGPAGRRLSEAASDAGERLGKAASAAGERLKAAAEEKGLHAEGLKEVGRDVAGTFEKSFNDDQQDKKPTKGSAE